MMPADHVATAGIDPGRRGCYSDTSGAYVSAIGIVVS
jgi:hypothetical protein